VPEGSVGVIDHAKSAYLGELALNMADKVLKPYCHALIKVSQGAGVFWNWCRPPRGKFARVMLQKPATSAGPDAEMYLLAMDFRLV
jgi:23S rRNA (uridine2552-2'-O)-methyltransferase